MSNMEFGRVMFQFSIM